MLHPVLTIVCTLAILGTIPGLSVLYREFLDESGGRASALLTLAISASAFALWLLLTMSLPGVASSPLYLPTAALAALSGFLASLTVRDTTTHSTPALLFSIAWTAAVFVPFALLVLFPASVGIGVTAGPLDLGGAIPVHAAVGSGAFVVLTFARRWTVEDRSHIRPKSWLVAGAGFAIWEGWILGLVGLELALDPVVTPRIIMNAIVAPILAIIGWLIIERIRFATTTAFGAVSGLLAGLVAITAGAAYFTPLWAGVTGAAAGIASSLFISGWVAKTKRHAWYLVGLHLLAATIGLVSLGLFGTDFGLIFDGQLSLLLVQVGSLLLVFAWSSAVSIVLWLLVRGAARRQREHRT